MSNFRGYAQENREGFNPIKAPDTSRRILEQADQAIRGLQAVRDADIANTAAYLQSFNQTQEAERQSLSNAGKLIDINFENRKQDLENQARQDAERKRLAGQNREAIYKNLAAFSTSAAKGVLGLQKAKETRDYNNELVRLYIHGLADNKDAQNYLADKYDESTLTQLGIATQARAAHAAETGTDSMAVAEIRAQDAGISVGAKRARAMYHGSRYGIYLKQALSNDNETPVKLYGPNGTIVDGTPNQARSSKDVAFVGQQLIIKYLKENGMHGMKSTFLVEPLRKMRSNVDNMVGQLVQNELNGQITTQIKDIEALFQANPTPQAFHEAVGRLQFMVPGGRAGAREHLFNLMTSNRKNIDGQIVGFSDNDVDKILDSSFSDQPNNPIKDRYLAEIRQLKEDRQRQSQDDFTAEQNANRIAIQKERNQVLSLFVEDITSGDSKLDTTDENLDFMINEYKKRGPETEPIVRALEHFRPFTSNRVEEAPFIEQIEKEIEAGFADPIEIMKKDFLGYKTRVGLAQKAKQTNPLSPDATISGKAKTFITNALNSRAALGGTRSPHRSLPLMIDVAIDQFNQDFMSARKAGKLADNDKESAYNYAIAQFEKEYRLEQKGKYALNKNYFENNWESKSFLYYEQYLPKAFELETTEHDIAKAYANDNNIINTAYVSDLPLKKAASQIVAGLTPDKVPQIEILQSVARKPNGQPYSYAEIFFKQMQAHGLLEGTSNTVSEALQSAIKLENTIPPRYRVLSIYKSARNSDIMLMASGGEPMYTRRPESQTNALIQAASTLGVDPVDLATIIGFETKGTYDPNIVGGENNNYKGLIQFGITERNDYGVVPDMTFEEQLLGPVVRYFQDRFAKAGLSTQGATLEDLYTTVIAGNPKANRNAKDAFGTSARSGVALMGDHRKRALRIFFGGDVNNTSFGDSVWQQGKNMNPALVERLSNTN